MRNRRGRCVGCGAAKHTACERRYDSDATCVCRCVDDNGNLEMWALVETARRFPESVAIYATVARCIVICERKRSEVTA